MSAGKVFICRCEDVTLHEIQEAVQRGYRDIESVKRFTGLGTGWCQGKSCLALCAQAIHATGGESPSEPFTPRPPFHPVRLGDLAQGSVAREKEREKA